MTTRPWHNWSNARRNAWSIASGILILGLVYAFLQDELPSAVRFVCGAAAVAIGIGASAITISAAYAHDRKSS